MTGCRPAIAHRRQASTPVTTQPFHTTTRSPGISSHSFLVSTGYWSEQSDDPRSWAATARSTSGVLPFDALPPASPISTPLELGVQHDMRDALPEPEVGGGGKPYAWRAQMDELGWGEGG